MAEIRRSGIVKPFSTFRVMVIEEELPRPKDDKKNGGTVGEVQQVEFIIFILKGRWDE